MSFKSNELEFEIVKREFPHRDRKGRQIGAMVRLSKVEVIEGAVFNYDHDGNYALWWPKEPGIYYAMWSSALRAGECFGPSNPRWHYKEEAERAAHVARYFKGAERAAAKREGK